MEENVPMQPRKRRSRPMCQVTNNGLKDKRNHLTFSVYFVKIIEIEMGKNWIYSLGIIGATWFWWFIQMVQFTIKNFKAEKAHFRIGHLFYTIITIRTNAIMIGSMMIIGWRRWSMAISFSMIARLIIHFLFFCAAATRCHNTVNPLPSQIFFFFFFFFTKFPVIVTSL